MRDFKGLVPSMFCCKYSVDSILATGNREVVVEFHHRVARRHRLGTVYLYFVVVLRHQRVRPKGRKKQQQSASHASVFSGMISSKRLTICSEFRKSSSFLFGRKKKCH